MAEVTASNGSENYLIEIQSLTGNKLMADEPEDKGGKNKGFSPKELLASALAACTNATLRMYASRKGWDLKNIVVKVELIEGEGKTTFNRTIHLEGDLDDTQRNRLLSIANVCPLHKILTHSIKIETSL